MPRSVIQQLYTNSLARMAVRHSAREISEGCLKDLEVLSPMAQTAEASGLIALAAVSAFMRATVAMETAPKKAAAPRSRMGSRQTSASRLSEER